MGIFDVLFGGLFDFDGNGKTTCDEEFIAMMLLNEMKEETEGADDDLP